jgi:tripartite-type tricarboxylate transporter receptor subunit TctC
MPQLPAETFRMRAVHSEPAPAAPEDRLRRHWLRGGLAALAALGGAPRPVGAQPGGAGYPSRPVRIIVPFTPGGSTDILARAVGQSLAEAWKQQVIVENKPGAGGSIGAEAAARAAPDGHTLLMGHIGTLAVNPSLYPKLPYDPVADFAPIALVAMVPNVLVVNPAVPARSVPELIALARARPGELTYASGGAGSAAHLAMEYFKLAAGVDILHVPYKGTAPAVTDLIGGQVSMTMTGLPPVLQQVRAAKLRALGVASLARLRQLPDVPTLSEAGVPGFEATQWYGLVAPVRTPAPIVDALAAQVQRSLATPALQERLEAEGAVPAAMDRAAFGRLIRTEIERWAKVVRDARITI